jgi:hypothetical protein
MATDNTVTPIGNPTTTPNSASPPTAPPWPTSAWP